MTRCIIKDFWECHSLKKNSTFLQVVHLLWIDRIFGKNICENNIVWGWSSVFYSMRYCQLALRSVSPCCSPPARFNPVPNFFASSPELSVSLTILMSTSSNEQLSNWTEKVLERRKTTANFMCFFLEGHTDCGDLNHLLRDANINERGRLADILILDRSLLTTCCIILSHVSLEISDVGRLFYNDLIIFELSA